MPSPAPVPPQKQQEQLQEQPERLPDQPEQQQKRLPEQLRRQELQHESAMPRQGHAHPPRSASARTASAEAGSAKAATTSAATTEAAAVEAPGNPFGRPGEAPDAGWRRLRQRGGVMQVMALLLVLASLGWVSVFGFVEPWIALAFGGFVAVGELARTPLQGERDQAPLGAAGALAYALLGSLAGARTHHGVAQVVLVCTAAALIGTTPRLLSGGRPNWGSVSRRALSVGFAALLFQPLYHRGVLLRHGLEHGPGYAAYVAGCAVLSAVVDVSLAALLSDAPLRRALRDEATAMLGIGSAVAATGVVIAVAAGEIGLWALPLFSVPLLLTLAGFRRYAAIRATQRQTIASLARATEVAGYTLPGHARRVSELACQVGRELGLSDQELLLLEYAALMHDIGQLSLVDPIPGGATALLDDEEQRRIGRLGSEVIRRTGVPPQVAEIVARAAEPYRRPDGRVDADLPVAARIIRVANAYDDLACDDPGPARRQEVLAQLRAGTERDFEPGVVEALARVCPRISG